ncbi:MAG: hypothetical protein ING65_08995 [Rhodocyclaceae bacterium]|nr:hypothetical protein [Rhodocyclaceae bacterium]
MNHAYLGNAWYHMQLLLNAGQRNGYGHSVIPWEYVPGFLAPLNKEVGDKLPGFALIWTRKGLDEGDNGHTPKEMIGWHFSRARLNFLNLFDYENGKTFNKFWFEKQTPEGKKVLDLFVQVAAEKDASWLAEQYPRRDNWASVAPRDPQDCSDSVHEDGAHWSSPKFRVDLPMTYDCEVRSIAVSTFSFLKLASERKSFHPALINSRVPSSCHLSADYRTEMA